MEHSRSVWRLWHLRKVLGLNVTSKDSGFPYFQISGGGMETVG